jgi:hypothetical protein
MKSVARDAFGVLSAKNTVSKYWGVSKVKNKDQFTVRFYDKVNQEIITFKPVNYLSEALCARIAARFFDEPSLYATSSEAIVMQFGGYLAKVNTCTNTIEVSLAPESALMQTEEIVSYQGEFTIDKSYFPQTLDVMKSSVAVGKSVAFSTAVEIAPAKKPKKEKVVDHFRDRVNQIMLDALNSAKSLLASRNAIYL